MILFYFITNKTLLSHSFPLLSFPLLSSPFYLVSSRRMSQYTRACTVRSLHVKVWCRPRDFSLAFVHVGFNSGKEWGGQVPLGSVRDHREDHSAVLGLRHWYASLVCVIIMRHRNVASQHNVVGVACYRLERRKTRENTAGEGLVHPISILALNQKKTEVDGGGMGGGGGHRPWQRRRAQLPSWRHRRCR